MVNTSFRSYKHPRLWDAVSLYKRKAEPAISLCHGEGFDSLMLDKVTLNSTYGDI